MTTYTKDPDAILDYAFDWTDWLGSLETISSFTITVASGDVVVASSPAPAEDGGVITYWLEGGTEDTAAEVTCHVVTSLGREDDRTDTFQVEER